MVKGQQPSTTWPQSVHRVWRARESFRGASSGRVYYGEFTGWVRAGADRGADTWDTRLKVLALEQCWMLTACWAQTGFCRCRTCSIYHPVHVWMHKPRRLQNPVVYLFLQYSEQNSWDSDHFLGLAVCFLMCNLSSCIWDQLGQNNPKIKADQRKGCFHSRCCHVNAEFLLW